jgi:uncharacterized membrane protein YbaN (DUF454 family)
MTNRRKADKSEMVPLVRGSARPPRKGWRRWAVSALGVVFLIIGVAGLVLPFLQGIVFLLAGLWVLSLEVGWARRLRLGLIARAPPWAARRWRRAEALAQSWLPKVTRR